jgi:hypothetical protein
MGEARGVTQGQMRGEFGKEDEESEEENQMMHGFDAKSALSFRTWRLSGNAKESCLKLQTRPPVSEERMNILLLREWNVLRDARRESGTANALRWLQRSADLS